MISKFSPGRKLPVVDGPVLFHVLYLSCLSFLLEIVLAALEKVIGGRWVQYTAAKSHVFENKISWFGYKFSRECRVLLPLVMRTRQRSSFLSVMRINDFYKNVLIKKPIVAYNAIA
jgi:hypothetical protein